MTEMLTYLETIARETHKTESEVMTLAIETGVRQLWREHILGRYLRGETSRDEAIKSVGIDWVELAERQRQAVTEDITWALGK
jgi:ribonuclease BN (tRNA processing enzyme)